MIDYSHGAESFRQLSQPDLTHKSELPTGTPGSPGALVGTGGERGSPA